MTDKEKIASLTHQLNAAQDTIQERNKALKHWQDQFENVSAMVRILKAAGKVTDDDIVAARDLLGDR